MKTNNKKATTKKTKSAIRSTIKEKAMTINVGIKKNILRPDIYAE